MKQYIGIDAHSSTCNFCVMGKDGVIQDEVKIVTNGRLLREYVENISGKKKITFEECELSSWLYEIFKGEDCEILVCNPVANGKYKGPKTDKLDARQLADLLRGNYLRSVYHDGSERERFRDLMSEYEDVVRSIVRIKNRYKSLFRKAGDKKKGSKVYKQEEMIEEIKRKDFHFIAKRKYRILREFEEIKKEYEQEIKKQNKKFKEIKVLKTLPGIADIQAAKIVSQVIEPKRFKNKYKYYSYCGLVRHKQISADKNYGNKKIWGNLVLKCVYKMAAKSAIGINSVFKEYYEKLREEGKSHKNARNAVSRKIAAISLVLWKKNEKFKSEMLQTV